MYTMLFFMFIVHIRHLCFEMLKQGQTNKRTSELEEMLGFLTQELDVLGDLTKEQKRQR